MVAMKSVFGRFWAKVLTVGMFFLAPLLFGAPAKMTFTVGNGTEPQTLDPAFLTQPSEQRIFEALFEGLVQASPDGGRVRPGLADSWSVSSDGLTWTFLLRPAVWSDGRPIRARDVVQSWLRELDPKTHAPGAELLVRWIQGARTYNEGKAGPEAVRIRAVDSRTFQMTATASLVPLSVLSQSPFAVLPMHVVEKYGAEWAKPEHLVGNGPFKLEAWKPEESLSVVKNPDYWDKSAVALQRIVFLPLNDDQAWSLFKKGKLDWDTRVGADHLGDAAFLDSFQNVPTLETYAYIPNEKVKPLEDVRIRQALSLAIDRSALVGDLLRGGEFPLYSVSPGFLDYVPPEMDHENILQAQNLLNEAGYPDGKGFPKLTLGFNEGELHQAIAEFVQKQWKKNLGIEVELKAEKWKDFLADRATHAFDLFRSDWVGDFADPLAFLEPWQSGSPDDVADYHNPDFDKLIAQLRTLPDGVQRLQTLSQAETLLIKDQATIPLFVRGSPQLIDLSKWDGWYNNTANVHPWKFIRLRQ
jgi:oligopeptide transport system substrate-binding protein